MERFFSPPVEVDENVSEELKKWKERRVIHNQESLAELFIYEYGWTLKQFYHDHTPDQIRRLHKHIVIRRLQDQINAASITHGDPAESLKNLESQMSKLVEPEPMDMYNDNAFKGLNVNQAVVVPKKKKN